MGQVGMCEKRGDKPPVFMTVKQCIAAEPEIFALRITAVYNRGYIKEHEQQKRRQGVPQRWKVRQGAEGLRFFTKILLTGPILIISIVQIIRIAWKMKIRIWQYNPSVSDAMRPPRW
jgi:hypothetical protein